MIDCVYVTVGVGGLRLFRSVSSSSPMMNVVDIFYVGTQEAGSSERHTTSTSSSGYSVCQCELPLKFCHARFCRPYNFWHQGVLRMLGVGVFTPTRGLNKSLDCSSSAVCLQFGVNPCWTFSATLRHVGCFFAVTLSHRRTHV